MPEYPRVMIVKAARDLGAEGVLLASGIILADDPERALLDLVSKDMMGGLQCPLTLRPSMTLEVSGRTVLVRVDINSPC